MSARPAHRKLAAGKLVVASHNPGKAREMVDLLRPYEVEVVSAAELGLPEPEETGSTFRENAEIKARAAASAAKLPALADDSGLAVDALNGAPGIYSARWAGLSKDFAVAMERVRQELEAARVPEPQRTARFISVLSLAWPDGHIESFEGEISGHLVFPPRGTNGFGYDPIFVPEGEARTFGELDPDHKHRISHRARAFQKLIAACFGA